MTRTSKQSKPSGGGERAAIGGYTPQYVAAVHFALRALRSRTLREVRLADLDVGKVDDLVLVLHQNEVHGYQMKAESGPLTFNDFARNGGLLHQLAQGWIALRRQYPTFTAYVHLITDQALTTSTDKRIKMAMGNPAPKNRHFKAFWDEAWIPYQNSLRDGREPVIPDEWQVTFAEWKLASGLADDDFHQFAHCVSVAHFPDQARIHRGVSDQQLARTYHLFQSEVAKAKASKEPVVVNATNLIETLGLQFKLQNQHSFPVSRRYRPIEQTVQALTNAVSTFRTGYVVVIGPPGTGKSSLVTKALVETSRPERIVRYYCHVPNEGHAASPRGEAANFLNDLVEQLETEYGITSGDRLPDLDMDALRARFVGQLHQLGDDYLKNGTRTIILVDGLDYVTHTLNNYRVHPLYSELPAPEAIPDGVLFVIGTQHIRDVPLVSEHLRLEPLRKIEMSGLTQSDVLHLTLSSISQTILSIPGTAYSEDPFRERTDRIFALSEGHPLALDYLLNRIEIAIAAGDDLDLCLNGTLSYDGNIYRHYSKYWFELEATERSDLHDFIGMLARIRGALDFGWMRTWPERSAVQLFEKKFGHFIHHGSGHNWQFFHDSFRLFLLDRSQETIDGLNPEEGRRFFGLLAERCKTAPPQSVHSWDATHYLWLAGQNKAICDLATPEYFDAQLVALRPVDDILADCRTAARSAALLQDPVQLLRGLLVLAEYEQRYWNIDQVEDRLVTLLAKMGRPDIASAWVLNGGQLRTNRYVSGDKRRIQALRLSRTLEDIDERSRSFSLFEIAEPHYLLHRGVALERENSTEQMDTLRAWADVVSRFKDIPEVIVVIRSLHWKRELDDPAELADDQITRHFQNLLLKDVAFDLLRSLKWDEFELIAEAMQTENIRDRHCLFQMYFQGCMSAWEIGEDVRSMEYADRLLVLFPTETVIAEVRALREETERLHIQKKQLGPANQQSITYQQIKASESRFDYACTNATWYAMLAYRIRQDKVLAANLIEGIPWFSIPDVYYQEPLPSENGVGPQLCTLRTAITSSRPKLKEIVPDRDSDRDELRVMHDRAIYRLAMMRGERLAGLTFDAFAFRQDVTAILHFWRRTGYSNYQYQRTEVRDGLPDMIAWLAYEAEQRGESALYILQDELDRIWNNLTHQGAWSADLRRRCLAVLVDIPKLGIWARTGLKELLGESPPGTDVLEQVEDACYRAEQWVALDENQEATKWIARSVSGGLGIAREKDTQVSTWVRWAMRHNEKDTIGAPERIELWANRLIALKNAGGGTSACIPLMEGVFRWSPLRAVDLFWWCFENDCLWYKDTLESWTSETIEHGISSMSPSALFSAAEVLCALVLPVHTETSSSLPIRELLEATLAVAPSEFQVRASMVWHVTSSECDKRIRSGIADQLAILATEGARPPSDFGLTSEDLSQSRNHAIKESNSEILHLRTGETFTLAEVTSRVRNEIASIKELAQAEDTPEHALRFNWSRLVREIAPNIATLEDIRFIIDDENGDDERSATQAALGLRALQLGDPVLAEELAKKSLAASRDHGWAYYLDGGSRQAAYQLLVRINSAKYRPLAFKQFSDDLTSIDGKMVAQAYLDMLDIFGAEDLIPELAEEVEKYAKRLFRQATVSDEKLEFLAKTATLPESPQLGLAYVMATHMVHPSTVIAQRACRGLALLLRNAPTIGLPATAMALRGDEPIQLRALTVCESVALTDTQAVQPLSEDIRPLVNSPHFEIAVLARDVLTKLGEPPSQPVATVLQTPMPYPILQMPLEHEVSMDALENPSVSSSLKLHLLEMIAIARHANMSIDEVVSLASKTMSALGLTAELSKIRESKLRAILPPIKLPYTRPHVLAARKALNHLVVRLVTEGRIPFERIESLHKVFRTSDPELLTRYPVRLPHDILPLVDHEDKSAFLANIPEFAMEGSAIISAGNIVLAARHRQYSERGDLWQQYEVSTLALPDAGIPLVVDQDDNLFSLVSRCTVSDYRTLRTSDASSLAICIESSEQMFDSAASDWLAIIPSLAKRVGLIPHPTLPLAWIGNDDSITIQSIWWMDGSQQADRVEADSGWRVISTVGGWHSISEAIGPAHFVQVKRVTRGNSSSHEPIIERTRVLPLSV